MSIIKELLTEKLRPKKFEQVILTKRLKKIFNNGELTQNILLTSTPGTGKTTIAKILSNDYPTLYINISSERGIDTVREKITDFISTKSLIDGKNNDTKVVILDEMDGGTDMLFKALRATMEKFSDTRFIATCNYLSKIPDPIQSRFSVIHFSPQTKDEEEELLELYVERVKKVSDKLSLKWKSDEMINTFIRKNFPDMRKIFSILQDLKNTSEDGVIDESMIIRSQYGFLELFKTIINPNLPPKKNYELIMQNYQGKSDEIFASLVNEFPEWIFENHPKIEPKIPTLIQYIADWDYKRKFLIDENLGILACVFQCQTYLKN